MPPPLSDALLEKPSGPDHSRKNFGRGLIRISHSVRIALFITAALVYGTAPANAETLT